MIFDLDLLQSVGVLIAATLIWVDHDSFRMADPICTLIFSVIVMFTTVSLVKDALKILMESVPESVDFEALEEALNSLSDVANVHDLHVWNLSVGKVALSAHLVVSASTMDVNGNIIPTCLDGVLRSAQKICRDNFGIDHCTIQIEWPRALHRLGNKQCPAYCDESINSSPYKSPQVSKTKTIGIDTINHNNDGNGTTSKRTVNVNKRLQNHTINETIKEHEHEHEHDHEHQHRHNNHKHGPTDEFGHKQGGDETENDPLYEV